MKYITIAAFSLLLLAGLSCDITDSDCSPNNDRYRIVGYEQQINLISIEEADKLSFELSTISEDTVSSSEFAIVVDPQEEDYNSSENQSVSLSKAENCSSPTPITSSFISGVTISSEPTYNEGNTDYANFFDVIVIRDQEEPYRTALTSYLDTVPPVPNKLILIPTIAPDATKELRFFVKLDLNGGDIENYEFSTPEITIR